jgi:sigma-B regulation protein RsbU (phosphoserine phosphatase)
MLDALTLRVAFTVSALILLLLFSCITYRTTRSVFSLWWCAAITLFLAGSAAYLLDFTPQQWWANPLGNGLNVAGAASVWRASRSLRGAGLPLWVLAVPPVVVILVSASDSPGTNDWSGGPLFLASLTVLLGLSARELLLLDPLFSRTRWPLFLASGALSAYYLLRTIAFLAVGPDGALFRNWFGTPSTALITLVLLIVVSFSMASLSGEQAARESAAQAARTGKELARAGDVQRRLLPKSVPDLPGYEIAGACVPSGAVSGDFFDWQRTSGGLAVTVADVMGKGVGAAMIAATVRAALRGAIPANAPGSVMTVVDTVVEPDLALNDAFVTLLHLQLDTASGEVTVVDAGHGLGVVSRADGSRELIPSRNLPLGVLGPQEWRTSSFRLSPGDLVLIFSDGVLDLFDETLASVLRAVDVARAAAPTAAAAVESLTALTADTALPDDVTVVAIRCTG